MGFVLGIAVKDGRMDIMKMLLEKGADIREGNVLGCVIRRSKMEITKIILLKPHQKDNDVRPKIAMICILLFLDFIPNEEEPTWKNVICLIPSIKMLIFCGEPRDWTYSDEPIVSDICTLPSCELQTHEKYICKENKNFLVNTYRKGNAIFLESIYQETVFDKMLCPNDQGLADMLKLPFDVDNQWDSIRMYREVFVNRKQYLHVIMETTKSFHEKNVEKYVYKIGKNSLEVHEREDEKKTQESNLNENDDELFGKVTEKLKEKESSAHTNDSGESNNESMREHITEITERNHTGNILKMGENEEESRLERNCEEDDDLNTVDDTQGIGNDETGIHTIKKRKTSERIVLFGEGPNEKERKNFLLLTTKHVLKSMKDVEFTEQKVVNRKSEQKISNSTMELIKSVRLRSYQTNVYAYYVPDVMTRLSSYSHWPHHNIRTGPLVAAGFSCKDPQTAIVICTACGFELNASSLKGTPLKAHQENSSECEFFNQLNSRNTDGGETGASSNTASDYAIEGATASADPHISTDDPKLKDTIGQGEIRDDLRQDNAPSKAPQGNNAGNIHIDDAPIHHERGQTDTCIADRPRTGEVFDRAALNVPNSNNVTSSGEAVREIEPMVVGAEASDVPYQIRNARYTELNARRESYTHWPHRNAHDIDRLVTAGFFYTGAEDIVRCFYCDIGLAEWDRDDDPWVEHARHSPECPYLRNQKGQDYINNIQTQWARIYAPKHPQHSQVEERRRTFRHENWPRDNVLQTPVQLAAAGFFYTGDGDTVRCHYCDGGLREWEPEDDPWGEHARWFPFCKFVLKIKGVDFIKASADGNVSEPQSITENLPPPGNTRQGLQTLGYVDTCRIKEQRNPLYSAAAQSVRSMDHSKATIRMVINCYIENTGRRDFKATDLMDIIMDKEETDGVLLVDDGEDSEDEIGPDAGMAAAGSYVARGDDEEMEFSPAAIKEENEYLKKKFRCKVCDEKERCIVFVPCGHRVTCKSCGEQASTCPHCYSKIYQRYKTYLE
ncbi:uncharacterized protein [Argopecten irradians]|uniref:uncharacterized protein isoform X2 n=1 Tax=Argopecten irradians TaxID=31199 RepID=UPI003722AFD8